MIKLIKTLFLTGSILDIREYDDYIYIIDNTYTIDTLDKNDFNIKTNHTVTTQYKPLHKYSHSTKFSSNALLILGLQETNRAFLLSLIPKIEHLSIIDTHQKPLESALFDIHGETLITGGMDGKTFIHDTKYHQVLSTLPNKPDYIASLQYSLDNSLLLSNCYNKISTIFNIDKNQKLATIKLPDVVEDAIFYDQNQKIYFVCRNGASIIYSLNEKKILDTQNHFSQWPTKVKQAHNPNYILVGTRSNNLYVVDITTHSIMFKVALKNIGINSIEFFNNYLLLGYSDSAIDIIDYNNGIQILEEALEQKDYYSVKSSLDDNIFLSLDPLSQRFDEAWTEVIKECIKLLNDGNIENAIHIATPFLDNKNRAKEFDFYTSSQEKVQKLQLLIDKKEIIEAYAYCEKYPYLKKIFLFNELEALFNTLFNRVKSLMEENPIYNKDKAKEIIKPYFKIALKKELVVNLLSNFDKFAYADTYVKKQEFVKYFKLIKEYPFLKGTSLYTKVMRVGDRLFSQLLNLEQNGEYHKSVEVIKLLSAFTEYKNRIDDIVSNMKYRSKFVTAVNAKVKKSAYDILEHYEKARFLPEFVELNSEYIDAINSAKSTAYNADIINTKKILQDYLNINYTSAKAHSFIKIAYLQEIQNNVDNNNINWDSTILTLINLFGKSSDIQYICQKIPKAWASYTNIESNGNMQGYKDSILPNTIIVN